HTPRTNGRADRATSGSRSSGRATNVATTRRGVTDMRYHTNAAGQDRSSSMLGRREVLAAGLGAAAAQLISGAAVAGQSQEPGKEKGTMKTRKLGNLEVSELGFGNMGLSGGHYGPGVDRAQGIRVIRDAHEPGDSSFAAAAGDGPYA